MARKKLPYQIGSLVSVLDDAGGFLAICRIEAADMHGCVIGRFFLNTIKDEMGRIRPAGESFVWEFGDLHILEGKWPVHGLDPAFRPDPAAKFHFFHKSPWPNQSRIDTFDVNAHLIASSRVPEGESPDLPPSLLKGAGSVEFSLTQVIAGIRNPHFQ